MSTKESCEATARYLPASATRRRFVSVRRPVPGPQAPVPGLPTLGEADVRDELPAVVEGHHVLQRVGVDHQEAAVVQTHRQSFAVGGEGATAPAFVSRKDKSRKLSDAGSLLPPGGAGSDKPFFSLRTATIR